MVKASSETSAARKSWWRRLLCAHQFHSYLHELHRGCSAPTLFHVVEVCWRCGAYERAW